VGAPIRQNSFASGELAPALHSRTDLDQYKRGARRLRNWFVSKHGALLTRPGLAKVVELKDSSKTARLIRFVYSDDTSYVLEVGDLYIRLVRDGAQVLSGGVAYEVVSPYAVADLPKLDITQSGDVLFLACPGYAPRTLSRIADTTWTFAVLDFTLPVPWNYDFYLLDPVTAADATHPAKGWTYLWTTIGRTTEGVIIESAPTTITRLNNNLGVDTGAAPTELVVYDDKPTSLVIGSTAGLLSSPSNLQTNLGYRFYRGRNGLFGLVGELLVAPASIVTGYIWKDYGQTPDYTRPPPSGRNPFQVFDAGGALVRTETPRTVCFAEDRLIFGGTAERPDHIFCSVNSSYLNFDQPQLKTASMSTEFELASRRREEIRALVSSVRLVSFTNSAPWAISGPGGDPIAANQVVAAQPQNDVGAAWLKPLEVGDDIIFARVKGTGVRNLSFDPKSADARKVFTSADISILAQHLFDGYTLVDWAYAEDPWGVIWAVRSDGKLLSLTYVPEYGVVAWALHETDGLFEAVCSVPETTEDAVYVVVQRTINGATKRYIERMTNRVVTETTAVKDLVCWDSAITVESVVPFTNVTGLDHLEGEDVYALADGVVRGPFTVVAGAITLDEAASTVHVGLPYTCTFETLDLQEARTDRKTVTKISIEVEASRGLSAGDDPARLVEFRSRSVADSYGAIPLTTGLLEVTPLKAWGKEGRITIQQSPGLPSTIYGVTREVEGGGRP
jgi:hypothetical protein